MCNKLQLTPIDLADRYGFPALADELRLRANSSLSLNENSDPNSGKIHVENATVVRLVVKKRNVKRCDAWNQVNEDDLQTEYRSISQSSVSKNLTNQRFDISELLSRVETHERSRMSTITNGDQFTDVLMHSMDSLNQQNKNRPRSKLPAQTYAPWLKTGDITPRTFEEEIR